MTSTTTVDDPCSRAREERARYYARTLEMLRHAEGRTFDELCELVGRTAQVTFADYGCSGSRIAWHERVTITAFRGADPVADEDDEGWGESFLVPYFEIQTDDGGWAIRALHDLTLIEPADRVMGLCELCYHEPSDHGEGCPTQSDDRREAEKLWQRGYDEFMAKRTRVFYSFDIHPSNQSPTFKLGFTAAQRFWNETHA